MASKVIAIAGAGPGVSLAVAEKFGKEGFKVALLARTKSKLDELAQGLKAQEIVAESFAADLTDAASVKSVLADAAEKLGPITVLLWNLYPHAPGSLLELSLETITLVNNAGITGFLTAVQTIAPGFEGQEGAAVLVTNGGLGKLEDASDKMCVDWGVPGLGYFSAAKHKIARMLRFELEPKGAFVGEVSINSIVKGTAWDRDGSATLEASTVADKFWELYTERKAYFADLA